MKLELRQSFLLTGLVVVFVVWLFESQHYLANTTFALVENLGVCQLGSSSAQLLTCGKYLVGIYLGLLAITIMAVNLIFQMFLIRKLMWGEILAALATLIILPAITVALMYTYFMEIGLTVFELMLGGEIPFLMPALLVNVALFGLAGIRFQPMETVPVNRVSTSDPPTLSRTKPVSRKGKTSGTR